MISESQFIDSGFPVAYTDACNRDIMALCRPTMSPSRYLIRLFDFNTDALLSEFYVSRTSASIFFQNHSNGRERNVVLQFPEVAQENRDKSQPQ